MAGETREFRANFIISAVDRASRVVGAFVNRTISSLSSVGAAVTRISGRMRSMGGAAVAMGAGIAGALAVPLKAALNLDDAMGDLTVAMMDKTGKVPKLYDTILKQTVELGNVLPGTTEDFVRTAQALTEQGTAMKAIANGGLKSAAYLSVVMKMPSAAAGEMVAKLREAFNLTDAQLGKMADYSQRAKFAYGLNSDDLLLGAKYYGSALAALKIQGADNVRRVYAIQGMAAGKGIDGSTFGTSFAQLLTRVSTMRSRLGKESKEMQAINATLAGKGIRLDFFDRKGNFKGLENMIAQFAKLKVLSQETQMSVVHALAGEEAGRSASILIDKGMPGYIAALKQQDNQASLKQRTNAKTNTSSNKIEALMGTGTNVLAAIGKPMLAILTPLADRLNAFLGGPVMKWIEKNQTLVGTIGLIVGGVAAFLVVGGGLLALLGSVGGAIGAGISALATFARGIRTVVQSLRFLYQFFGVGTRIAGILARIATLFSPVGIAIAVVAALLWKFHRPILGFFKGLALGIWEGVKPIRQALGPAFTWLGTNVLAPVARWLGKVWKWFIDLLAPVDDVGGAGEKMGKKWGLAIGGFVTWGTRKLVGFVKWLGSLIPSFSTVGDGWGNALARAFGKGISGLKSLIPSSVPFIFGAPSSSRGGPSAAPSPMAVGPRPLPPAGAGGGATQVHLNVNVAPGAGAGATNNAFMQEFRKNLPEIARATKRLDDQKARASYR